MDGITAKSSTTELKARVRSAEASGGDQFARRIGSVQQSLCVEAYDVHEAVLRAAPVRTPVRPAR